VLIEREKINEAKEKLGEENAIIMAKLLGLEDFEEKNLRARCPFHEEQTPSFIFNQKNYTFHCFGCSATVDIIDVYMKTGETYLGAVQKLFEKVGIQHSFGERGVKTKKQYKYPKEVVCTNKDKVYKYLGLRGISKETIDYMDVREDEKGNCAFNYYDQNDVLTMVKYRPARKVEKGEHKNWCQEGADTSPILFNMNRVNINAPLLITEGETDCLAAIEAGHTNTVSIPLGATNHHWIAENWEWLEQFDKIIICADRDDAGTKFQKEAIYRLGSWRTLFVEIPEGVNDLNEVLYRHGKERVMELIMNAKDSPVPSVRNLSDIKDVNLDSIEGIETGFKTLDKELMRIFYGTLTVVSGTPGSGKTSFLYQIICNALDQEKNAWLFSRELPEWMSKAWIVSILAGRHNIKEYENDSGATYHRPTLESKQAIDSYYNNKVHLYRDDYSEHFNDVYQSMEDSVRKYGCKLLIVDNLMTLGLDASENNILMKQTEVVNRLIALATKYNVAVMLVVHPRKMQRGVEVGIYDASGSSNIINLAHRFLAIKKLEDEDREKRGVNYNAMVAIIKDRIRGKANMKFGMYYDVPSRRFYTSYEEFAHNYAWDTTEYADKLHYPQDIEEVTG